MENIQQEIETRLPNVAKFRAALEVAYVDLFANHPDYSAHGRPQVLHGNVGSTVLAATTPASLAQKMTVGLIAGKAHHGGEGIKRACKAVGIKHTRKAILAFLTVPA